ncbi:MAG: molybdopterin converting factor subunit 1 [Emcibacter sp.]|nr:molybdopterin converting factor subunit 1 [Emcibacter sp.]
MELLYFAQLRETIGHGSETLSLPENIADVAGLIAHLREKDDAYRAAFDDKALIRVAVNQTHVNFDHPLTDRDEVAFFPPMTGG